MTEPENNNNKVHARSGFTVAVFDNGQFVFKPFGTNASPIEMQGLLNFAKISLDDILVRQMMDHSEEAPQQAETPPQ